MNFLDKLEKLLINSDNTNCSEFTYRYCDDTYIYLSATLEFTSDCKERERYIKDYIHLLKDDSINLSYDFFIDIFNKNEDNISMLDEILSLNPSEEELLVIFKHSRSRLNETEAFINLLNTKDSFMQMAKLGNNKMKDLNDKEFLDIVFFHGKKFHLSKDDYSDILIGYVNNSSFIQNRDELLQLCLHYVENEKIIPSLVCKMYGQKINLNDMIVEKQLTNIEINRLYLIKNYTLISEESLENLLTIFVNNISLCITDLSFTSSIQYLKKIDNKCTLTYKKNSIFSLLLDTTNSAEVLDILDCYLKLFVKFNEEDNNNAISNFKQHIEDNPQVFHNFILYKKLGKKLAVKNYDNIKNKI